MKISKGIVDLALNSGVLVEASDVVNVLLTNMTVTT